MKNKLFIVISILTLSILACQSSGGKQSPSDPVSTGDQPGSSTRGQDSDLSDFDSLPAGDPGRGERLFNGQANDQVHCATCHSLTTNQTLVGPSLAGIAGTAAMRLEGTPAEDYLYQSIIEPDSYVVEGYQSSIMPGIFKRSLSSQDLADLVAFLMSQ